MSHAARAEPLQHYRELFEAARPRLTAAAAARARAFARFAELGLPGAREEAWKYTSLRRLEGRRFELPEDADFGATGATVAQAHEIVLVNGRCTFGGALPAGVRLRTLAQGALQGAALETALAVATGGGTERFAALNAALCPDVVEIELEPGVKLESPLRLVCLGAGPRPLLLLPRIRIRCGRGAAVRVLLQHRSDDGVDRLAAVVVDIGLGESADLHLYRVQQQGAKTLHVERIDAALARDASLVVHDASLGAALSRLDLNVALTAPGATARLDGLFLADGTRHIDTQLRVDHQAPHTTSEQVYHGIAAGRGRGVFNGKAVVHPGAQQTSARQSSRNLLLSPGAEIDTKPELEIYADDVQCSHGATTGQLDPAALFYLRSRGLDERAAQGALTRAFAGAVLSRIDLPEVGAAIHDALDARLEQLIEAAA